MDFRTESDSAAGATGATGTVATAEGATPSTKARAESFSQNSETSQTAADFIRDQLQLEADAREALPYSIEDCTKPLGALRQSIFSCLTCNPPPSDPKAPYDAAGICYSCSVQCHGEHTLVEIFNKRNFTCDCGTTRFPGKSPCQLRLDPATNTKGVHSEEPSANNKYNQNFRNRFCGCECDYDPYKQKGTMFQCLGLGTVEEGGCGEDWWHPGCLVGLGADWYTKTKPAQSEGQALPTIQEDEETKEAVQPKTKKAEPTQADDEGEDEDEDDDDIPPPPGFPADEDFDGFICYKCIDAFPWIKRYAGAPGFLLPVYTTQTADETKAAEALADSTLASSQPTDSKKRKAEDDEADDQQNAKRAKSNEKLQPTDVVQEAPEEKTEASVGGCKLDLRPPAPQKQFSLFFKDDFRAHICQCSSCFPLLVPHPQLLEEEETYEPPVSEPGSEHGGSTHGSGSLLDRGESALRNVDRLRAIEGVMAYNHLKDKLKPFFQQFAESGEAISAEHIKEYFAKLRGDEGAIQEAGDKAKADHREEQSGY